MTALIAVLFYSSFLAVIVFSPGVWIYVRRWERIRISRKQQEFTGQLQNALESVASSLNVGYSMENAVKEAAKEMRLMYAPDTIIVKELARMCRQLEIHVTVEQTWRELAERTGLPDVISFVNVLTVAKRSGGDSIRIIRSAVRQIGEKVDVHREIETILAAKRLEFQIMSAVPFGIIGYMRFSFPEFMGQLYGGVAGVVFMTVCLGVYAAAWKLGDSIVRIEV